MKKEAEKILQEALALPPEDRETIAELLFQSIDGRDHNEIELEWQKEIRRRLKEVENGEVEMVPWEVVRDEVLKRIAK